MCGWGLHIWILNGHIEPITSPKIIQKEKIYKKDHAHRTGFRRTLNSSIYLQCSKGKWFWT